MNNEVTVHGIVNRFEIAVGLGPTERGLLYFIAQLLGKNGVNPQPENSAITEGVYELANMVVHLTEAHMSGFTAVIIPTGRFEFTGPYRLKIALINDQQTTRIQ